MLITNIPPTIVFFFLLFSFGCWVWVPQTLKLGSLTTIVISSPEAAKEILLKNDETFSARTVSVAVSSQPNPEATVAWVTGDHHKWKTIRRFLSIQMFSNQRLDSLQELRHRKAEQLVNHIRKMCQNGESVDIGRVAFATTFNIMSNTIFSIDMVDPEFEEAHEFKDLVLTIMEDAGKPNLSDFFPVLSWLDLEGVKRRIRRAYLRLHEIVEDAIEKRLQGRKSMMMKTCDLLDALLDQCDEEGSGFDRTTIKPFIVDLFIAGTDTASITTEWAMVELLRKPQELEKVREEILQQIGRTRLVKESDINKLRYLPAVVKETIRLHPPAPLLLPRKAQHVHSAQGQSSFSKSMGTWKRPKILERSTGVFA